MIVADGADNFGYPVVDLPESACASPEAAVKFLVGELVESGRLRPENADRVVCQVLRRESLGSTAYGHGFAVPHSTKCYVVSEVLGIVGRSTAPVEWPGRIDSAPVRVVCLLVTPVSEPETSLRALEAVMRRIKSG